MHFSKKDQMLQTISWKFYMKKKKRQHVPPKQWRYFTVVTFTGNVFNLQCPRPLGVLVPRVGGHESPVVKTLWRIIMRPWEKKKHSSSRVNTFCLPRVYCVCVCTVVYLVLAPGVKQCGASTSWTNEVDGQIPPAVVGQGEPGLDMF